MSIGIDIICITLTDLKTRYGVRQAKIAADMGISPQALTDIKAGRRRFTPKLGEKLLQANAGEPWAGWLAEQLAQLAVEPGKVDNVTPISDKARTPALSFHIPLLHAPFFGDPQESPTRDDFVDLPRWARKLVSASDRPYALELATDDYMGRLRAGDLLLVAQAVWPGKEIMVVECAAGLRVARSDIFDVVRKSGSRQWLALDSGEPIPDAVPIATVAGILMAIL